MLNVLRLMQRLDMTVEEVDACTGPAIGWPKSATFRTADMVGLDVLAHVVRNIYENAPDDESREIYRVPPLIEEMIKRGWLGEKTGSGFYKRVKKGGESRNSHARLAQNGIPPAPEGANSPPLKPARPSKTRASALRALLGPGVGGQGRRQSEQISMGRPRETCLYAARRVPEIADRIVDVDRAMRWGFAWELGPFEIWDAIGVERMAQALEREGEPMPPLVDEVLASPARNRSTRAEKGTTRYFDLRRARSQQPFREPPGIIILEIAEGAHASGAGKCRRQPDRPGRWRAVLRIPLQDERHRRRYRRHDSCGLARLDTEFDAMVIANQAANFSAGANLMLAADQRAGRRVGRHSPGRPPIPARQSWPSSMRRVPWWLRRRAWRSAAAAKSALHAARIHAAAEAYIGLVETGVGLIPGGGGTKEMLIRANEHAAGGEDLDLFHALKPRIRKYRHGQSLHQRRGSSLARLPASRAI